jgi:hypothetical protein
MIADDHSNHPTAWLTDTNELYFDKQDAIDNSHGFIEPLYTQETIKKILSEIISKSIFR